MISKARARFATEKDGVPHILPALVWGIERTMGDIMETVGVDTLIDTNGVFSINIWNDRGEDITVLVWEARIIIELLQLTINDAEKKIEKRSGRRRSRNQSNHDDIANG